MKKIGIEEIKHIQLDILQTFHDFCVEHKIMYSLADGSLLGAIRHNGYIPWDDDIDVFLKRNDYERFVKIFPLVYRDRYVLASFETDTNYSRPYGKLYDKRTVFVESQAKEIEILGVNIDIFPLDATPSLSTAWERYNKKRRLLVTMFLAKMVQPMRSDRTLKKNIAILLLKGVLFFVSAKSIGKLVEKYAQKFNGKETEYLYENILGMKLLNPFKASLFSNVVLHKFENREFYVMEGYDECLTSLFGDYMTLPPENKRHIHHYYDAYWK